MSYHQYAHGDVRIRAYVVKQLIGICHSTGPQRFLRQNSSHLPYMSAVTSISEMWLCTLAPKPLPRVPLHVVRVDVAGKQEWSVGFRLDNMCIIIYIYM